MPLADYQKLLQEARSHQLVYLEDLAEDGEEAYLDRHDTAASADPLAVLEDADVRRVLLRGIEALPEREKLVMAMYYDEDMNLKEIGDVLGVTESRVCQLHSQAVARLRAAMQVGAEAPIKKRRGRPPKASRET
jgi:RNA polymerase sigma factor for flagellar operon FliA